MLGGLARGGGTAGVLRPRRLKNQNPRLNVPFEAAARRGGGVDHGEIPPGGQWGGREGGGCKLGGGGCLSWRDLGHRARYKCVSGCHLCNSEGSIRKTRECVHTPPALHTKCEQCCIPNGLFRSIAWTVMRVFTSAKGGALRGTGAPRS